MWEVVEELRIGSLDDPEVGFSSVADIELGRDGLLYVLDSQERQVRVFDRTGHRVRAFGRRGSGPGEFQDPESLGVVGDTVWVTEMGGNHRVTLFSSDGKLLATVPGLNKRFTGKSGRVIVSVVPGWLEPGGLLPSRYWYTAVGRSAGDTIIFPQVRFDVNGNVVDTIGWDTLGFGVRTGPRLTVDGVTLSRPGRPFLFDDEPIVAGEKRVHVERPLANSQAPTSFTVTLLSSTRDTMWSRRYTYRPVDASSEQIDEAVAVSGESFRFRGADSLQVDRAVREVVDFPRFLPSVTRVRLVDKEVWLRREDTKRDWRWTVLDQNGTPVGEITLPLAFTPFVFRPDELWGVHADEMDVPWIVRYRVIRL